jgi:hypothetical protein
MLEDSRDSPCGVALNLLAHCSLLTGHGLGWGVKVLGCHALGSDDGGVKRDVGLSECQRGLSEAVALGCVVCAGAVAGGGVGGIQQRGEDFVQ